MDVGKRQITTFLVLGILDLGSCSRDKTTIEIENYANGVIHLDYNNAINTGFVFPSSSNARSGYMEDIIYEVAIE